MDKSLQYFADLKLGDFGTVTPTTDRSIDVAVKSL